MVFLEEGKEEKESASLLQGFCHKEKFFPFFTFLEQLKSFIGLEKQH